MVSPKDMSRKEKQCGVVYSVSVVNVTRNYIGETARMLGTRSENTDGKHLTSAIVEHTSSTGHHYRLDDTKILVRETWFLHKI